MPRRRPRWVAVLYATLLEVFQYFAPGREVHLSDWAANVVGIFAGLVIVALWLSQLGKSTQDHAPL